MMRISANHRSAPPNKLVRTGATPYRGAPIGTKSDSPSFTDADELASLVRLCGIAYQFTEAEHAEALQAAVRDPESALACFCQIAAELSGGNHDAATTKGDTK